MDLSWYTTDAAVDDVEEVRTVLGYGPLNLMGTSYGMRAVLTYLRRHPGGVRTATLEGVLPPDVRFLREMPRNLQASLDGLVLSFLPYRERGTTPAPYFKPLGGGALSPLVDRLLCDCAVYTLCVCALPGTRRKGTPISGSMASTC